jgi:hypothetical protein
MEINDTEYMFFHRFRCQIDIGLHKFFFLSDFFYNR